MVQTEEEVLAEDVIVDEGGSAHSLVRACARIRNFSSEILSNKIVQKSTNVHAIVHEIVKEAKNAF